MLSSVSAQKIGFLTDEPQGESPAWQWLSTNHEAIWLEADSVATSGLPEELSAVWWHGRVSADMPDSLISDSGVATFQQFLSDGKGLFLSGFSTQYVVNLGIQDIGPGAVFPEPTTSSNWGFTPMNPGHPIFEGFTETPIVTLSAGNQTRNVISWWEDPSVLSGRWLADNENRINRVGIAEFSLGTGKLITVGSGAFDWHVPESSNQQFDNLVQLTGNILQYVSTPRESAITEFDLLARWNFEEEDGATEALDTASGIKSPVHNNFNSPERVSFPGGARAMIFDGYSTWIERPGNEAPMMYDEMTISAWVSPRSYPVEMAGLFSQYDDHGGYFLGLTRYGQWGLRASIDGMWHAIWAPEALPKSAWSHIAAIYKRGEGLSLYLNGEQVSHVPTLDGRLNLALGESLFIGRNNRSGAVAEIFPTAIFPGLMADVRIYRSAKTESEIAELMNDYPLEAGPAPFIHATQRRFADDPHRPVYHAIPEADWTNEPHGLVQDPNGLFHMFYQKNPAGPYWSFIHWGYMTSTDLVHWEHHPNALAPERGFSQYGAWSGDAAIDDGMLKLVYTAVDGARAVVAIAERPYDEDGEFHIIEENPVIDGRPRGETLLDYRDPYVWQNPGEDTWNLVIGAGIPQVGGTSLIYTAEKLSGPWTYQGHFFSGTREFNGDFWEMPVVIHFDEDHVWYGVSELPAINSYWIGEIQDHRFIPFDEKSKTLEVTNHLLSPTVTLDNQGRWVSIGIVPETRSSQEQLSAGWAHVYNLPRVWELDVENQRLMQSPLPELDQLRGQLTTAENITVEAGSLWTDQRFTGDTHELEITFDLQYGKEFDVLVRRDPQGREATRFRVNAAEGTFAVDRRQATLNPEVQRDIREGFFFVDEESQELTLRLYLDRSVIDGFLNDRDAFATRTYPSLPESQGVAIEAKIADVRVKSIRMWEMNPARMKNATIEELISAE